MIGLVEFPKIIFGLASQYFKCGASLIYYTVAELKYEIKKQGTLNPYYLHLLSSKAPRNA